MKNLLLFLSSLSALPAFSAMQTKATNSTLIIEQNDKEFQFKIEPNKGLAISTDGPWQLDISNINSVESQKLTFKKSNFDEKVPGYKVSMDELKKSSGLAPSKSGSPTATKLKSFNYKLTAFICTIDKTKCFRDVIKGEAQLTK
jgi:hypothetical protein